MSTLQGLSNTQAAARLNEEGPNEVRERKSHPLVGFLQKFWGLSAWMLELIALLSFILNKRADLFVALALLLVNAVLSFFQEQRASAAVAALRKRLQVTSRVLRDGEWTTITARNLVRGDVVRIRTGDFVPADAQILNGNLEVDQSALTGESHEIAKPAGATLYSGSIVRRGEATAVVAATGSRTYYGRTTELVQSAHPKLHIEGVITRVVKWLFLIVGTLVAITLTASAIEGLPLLETLPLSLVLLMSAIPVALPVMFTVSMALGSIQLASRGVLVTRLSAAEDAALMNVLCADKTGTLTMNRLAFAGALPQPGFSEDDVLSNGALASEEANQDPIDLAFLRAAHERQVLRGQWKTLSFVPFSPEKRRTEALIQDDTGTARVMKGALVRVAEAAGLDSAAIRDLEGRVMEKVRRGYRVLAVARGDGDEPLHLTGIAFLYDAPRPDSRQLINELHSLGVIVKMLTGDALPVARELAREFGLGEVVRASDFRSVPRLTEGPDGFAEVFPEDKFLVVKTLQDANYVVGMTGDGVNDAPALRQAEVGIAVSNASDVAKAAASVVLTVEGLVGIIDLVKNGRAIYQRVLTWIINKVSRTILKSGFVVIAFLATGQFVISALGMVLLVFMTDFVKIALSTDRVRPSRKPETWSIGPLVRLAVVMGLLMLAEALGLLAIGWRWFHLGTDGGRLQTFTFQTLLFFALFSIVSVRERRAFWRSRTSAPLAIALIADACAGAFIGAHGLAELQPLPLNQIVFIVIYALLSTLGVNDFVKTRLLSGPGTADISQEGGSP